MSPVWPTTTLGSLSEFRNGLNYTQEARKRGGLPIVGVKDFQDRSFIDYSTLEELDPNGVSAAGTLLTKGDILFVRSNGNRDLIGRSLFVLQQPLRPTTYSGFTIRLRFNDRRADPRFFSYLLRGPIIRGTLSKHGGGTNISNLNQGILSSLAVPLPPRDQQRRIASILSAYDDLIEVNRRRVTILEEMARRLFEEWFVHLRFPGHEGVSVQDTSHGPLPDAWAFRPLHDLVRVNETTLRPTIAPEKIRYVDIASVSPGRIDHAEQYAFADAPGRARRIVRDGSIIWSTVRPNRRGFAIVFNPEPDLIVSTGFAVLDAVGLPASYLYAWTTTDAFVSYLINHATGAAYPAVTGATFERAQVLVPTEAIADAYGREADPILRLADKLHHANARLAAARDLLLPRLVSGEFSLADASTTDHLLDAAD